MQVNSELMERRQAAVARGLAQRYSIFVERALNAELWDVEGRRYIDFCGGIAVLNTGHCHPRVVKAVSEQINKYSHTAFHVIPYESYLTLAERLNKLAPGDFPKKTILMNTGSEAVENAVKIARAYTKRPGIITFAGAFHGRTMMTLAMTGRMDPYKIGFAPFPSDVFHVPYPILRKGISVDDSINGIENLLQSAVEPDRVAAIVVEPVLGEGGYHPAPSDFLRRLRILCDKYGFLLISDEIQAGIGRTGKMFSIEHSGVVPDIVTLAKGLGAGLPIAAVVGRADIMDFVKPGGLGSTFAGNPLGCTAALAVLDVIQHENLLERGTRLGSILRKTLDEMASRYPVIGDVRGLGMMVAIEIVNPEDENKSASGITQTLLDEAKNRGLLLMPCGGGNVIRIMAPLTISEEVLMEGLSIIDASLAEITKSKAI